MKDRLDETGLRAWLWEIAFIYSGFCEMGLTCSLGILELTM